jgi:hypothetical protein
MAVRKFVLSFGQSNAGPSPDLVTWWQYHYGADLRYSTTFTRGAYSDKFTMPGTFPGYTTLDIKGRCISGLRVLTAYNPYASGYSDYPGAAKALGVGANYIDVAQYVTPANPITYPFLLLRKLTGELLTVNVSSIPGGLPTGATCRWTCTTNFSSTPQVGEQFYFSQHSTAQATESGGKTTVALQTRCGSGVGATDAHTYLGCRLLHVYSNTHTNNIGTSFVISAVSADGLTVTVDGTWTQAPHAGTQFAIVPGNWTVGTTVGQFEVARPDAFASWGHFLPWTSNEGKTTLSTLGESTTTNPYPPGFDYPNTFHVPPPYRTGTGTGIVSRGISYSIGLGLRFKQYYGETMYLVSSDIGGTPLAHSENPSGSSNYVGWHDGSQHCTWSPGESNGNFKRLLDELDMAIATSALAGDTLQCVGVFFIQGETDGSQSEWADAYESNLRQFKTRIRAELKARSLWTEDAETIPWIQPQISNAGGYWPYYLTINAAIERLAEEDRYMRTFSMSDAPVKVGDTAHYNGQGATMMEDRAFLAWRSIIETNTLAGQAELDICNLALSHIGDPAEITSISPPDGSTQATHCARFYPLARDSMLDMRSWTFATRRKALVSLENTRTEWDYAYAVPADCTTSFAILPPDVQDDYSTRYSPTDSPGYPANIFPIVAAGAYLPQPYTVETDEYGRQIIYTDQADAVIRYSASGTDATKFSPLFRMALSWHLASMLAGPIIKGEVGAAEAKRCAQMAQYYVGQADESDSNQRQIKPEHIVPWMSGR